MYFLERKTNLLVYGFCIGRFALSPLFALIPSAGNILPATSQVNDLVTGTKRMNRIWKNSEKYLPNKIQSHNQHLP